MSSILALAIIGSSVPPVTAMPQEAASAAALMAEVRHSFALNGKAIPPEIFRDFGDLIVGFIWLGLRFRQVQRGPSGS